MLTVIIAAALQLIVVGCGVLLLSRNIVRVPPHEIAVLSGRSRVERDPVTGLEHAVGYRVIREGSAFRIPFLEREDRLPLSEMSIAVDLEDQRDAEGRALHIGVLVNCRIAGESPLLEDAIQRFLGMALADIEKIVRTTIESRVIEGLLTTDLERDGMTWAALEQRLIAAIRTDLGALGVTVDNIVFRRPPHSEHFPAVAVIDDGLSTGNSHADRIDGIRENR